LTQAITFNTSLHTFMNNVYSEMLAGGFSSSDSWLLACTLANRVMTYVSEARTGAKELETGDPAKMAATCLWATLKAQQRMREFLKEGEFGNHNVITAERGRFTLLHSNFGTASKLEGNISKLKKQLENMQGDVKSAKSVSDNNNSALKRLKKKIPL